jgi:hypothetical protein
MPGDRSLSPECSAWISAPRAGLTRESGQPACVFFQASRLPAGAADFELWEAGHV